MMTMQQNFNQTAVQLIQEVDNLLDQTVRMIARAQQLRNAKEKKLKQTIHTQTQFFNEIESQLEQEMVTYNQIITQTKQAIEKMKNLQCSPDTSAHDESADQGELILPNQSNGGSVQLLDQSPIQPTPDIRALDERLGGSILGDRLFESMQGIASEITAGERNLDQIRSACERMKGSKENIFKEIKNFKEIIDETQVFAQNMMMKLTEIKNDIKSDSENQQAKSDLETGLQITPIKSPKIELSPESLIFQSTCDQSNSKTGPTPNYPDLTVQAQQLSNLYTTGWIYEGDISHQIRYIFSIFADNRAELGEICSRVTKQIPHQCLNEENTLYAGYDSDLCFLGYLLPTTEQPISTESLQLLEAICSETDILILSLTHPHQHKIGQLIELLKKIIDQRINAALKPANIFVIQYAQHNDTAGK